MYIGYIIHLREFSDDIDFADGCRVSACLCFLFFIDYCAVKSFVFCCSLCAAIVHGARFQISVFVKENIVYTSSNRQLRVEIRRKCRRKEIPSTRSNVSILYRLYIFPNVFRIYTLTQIAHDFIITFITLVLHNPNSLVTATVLAATFLHFFLAYSSLERATNRACVIHVSLQHDFVNFDHHHQHTFLVFHLLTLFVFLTIRDSIRLRVSFTSPFSFTHLELYFHRFTPPCPPSACIDTP